MKKALLMLFAQIVTLAGFWLGGFDFDQRGAFAVFVYISSLTVGGMLAFWLYWDVRP